MNTTGQLQGWQIDTLSRLYLPALSFSLVGSFSVVLASILKRHGLKDQVKPLVQLGLADFLASALLMGTNILNFLSSEVRSNVLLCELGLPLSLMFYCISFLLAILYACESTFATQGWRERMGQGDQQEIRRRCRKFWLLYAGAWLVPMCAYVVYAVTISTTMVDLLPVGATASSDSSGSLLPPAEYCTSCLLFLHIRDDNCSDVDAAHDISVRAMLFTSLLSVLVVCTVVYCKLYSWCRRYENSPFFPVEGDSLSSRRLKGALSSVRYIILIIPICWSPAFLLLSVSFIKQVTQEQLFPLYVIQALLVSLHGFLNSIVYAWRRPNFRDAVLGERLPLLSSRPYFEESLTPP
ncbi:uncharacterized protein si:dkey-30c15.2 [Clupea harengus]|uniref:Uncharacterized protein si:dkey-30c15.2 n=1 Tax=Clupea harengus TaxID=7950 RepID=A0A6P8FBF2_CLUHA|nr:uncharacterized protein si:dkey-30c15.2 [Clupea harengus]